MRAIELSPEHPVETVSDLAVVAEREGFDAVFASHHYNNRDEFAVLTDVARRTDRVRLGPGVANPYDVHPVALASRVATLEEVSDGRAVFGIGPGDRSTVRNLGFDREDALRRVLETVQVARRLWRGERVDHDGTFRADDAGLNYEVGTVPIYVGAQGPHMTRMAAKHADGVLFNGAHPRDLAWAAEQVERGAAERPSERGDVDLLAYASVSIAADVADAREAARPPVAFIAGGAPDEVLERHGLDRDLAGRIGAAIAGGEFSAAFDLVTAEMIDAFCVVGTPDRVADRIDALLVHADGIVVGSPLGPDMERAIELAARALDRSDRG